MSHADYIRAKFPNASQSFIAANSSGESDSAPPERPLPLPRTEQDQAASVCRPHICFTLRRVKLLDADAKYASVKDLLDGCCEAGLLPGDRDDQITLEVRQEKARHYKEEKTIIEITLP